MANDLTITRYKSIANNNSSSQYRHISIDNGKYRRYIQEGKSVSVEQKTLANNEDFIHGSYGGLLFDPRWRTKRLIILNRDGHKCVICGGGDALQVHHRQYHFIDAIKQFKPPWDYDDRLLISLCETCHKKGHRNYKVPTIKI
jgi:hypothetical protein